MPAPLSPISVPAFQAAGEACAAALLASPIFPPCPGCFYDLTHSSHPDATLKENRG